MYICGTRGRWWDSNVLLTVHADSIYRKIWAHSLLFVAFCCGHPFYPHLPGFLHWRWDNHSASEAIQKNMYEWFTKKSNKNGYNTKTKQSTTNYLHTYHVCFIYVPVLEAQSFILKWCIDPPVTARFVTRFNLWLRHDLWPHNASICDPARFVTKSASICDQRYTMIL